MNTYKFNLPRFRGTMVAVVLGVIINTIIADNTGNHYAAIIFSVISFVFFIVLWISFYCFDKVKE